MSPQTVIPPAYKITEQQLGKIIGILSETPYKFASPIHDILRVVITEQPLQQETSNESKKTAD